MTSCLQRIIKSYKTEEIVDDFDMSALFNSESSAILYHFTLLLYQQQKKLFKDFIGFQEI